jgi:hypothetical protein
MFVKYGSDRFRCVNFVCYQLVALFCFVGGMFVKYGSDDLKSMLPDLMRELVRKIDPILKGTECER